MSGNHSHIVESAGFGDRRFDNDTSLNSRGLSDRWINGNNLSQQSRRFEATALDIRGDRVMILRPILRWWRNNGLGDSKFEQLDVLKVTRNHLVIKLLELG